MIVICNKADLDCNVCAHAQAHKEVPTGSEICTEMGYCAYKDTIVKCVEAGK